MSIGLCIPDVCKTDDMNELKPYLMSSLNSELQNIFSEVEGYQSLDSVWLETQDIEFVNAAQLNSKYTSIDFNNVLFILFMTFLVLFSIGASVVLHSRYKQRKLLLQRQESSEQSEGNNVDSQLAGGKKCLRCLNTQKCKACGDKVLKAFSLKRNLRKLFGEAKYSSEDTEFEIINAVRVYSICIIVLGNTYFYTLSGPIQNLEIVSQLFKTKFFMFVFQADL